MIVKSEYGEVFHNFYDSKEVKVKELIVSPKKGMSFQKHKQRNEIWLVTKGSCEVNSQKMIQSKKNALY